VDNLLIFDAALTERPSRSVHRKIKTFLKIFSGLAGARVRGRDRLFHAPYDDTYHHRRGHKDDS